MAAWETTDRLGHTAFQPAAADGANVRMADSGEPRRHCEPCITALLSSCVPPSRPRQAGLPAARADARHARPGATGGLRCRAGGCWVPCSRPGRRLCGAAVLRRSSSDFFLSSGSDAPTPVLAPSMSGQVLAMAAVLAGCALAVLGRRRWRPLALLLAGWVLALASHRGVVDSRHNTLREVGGCLPCSRCRWMPGPAWQACAAGAIRVSARSQRVGVSVGRRVAVAGRGLRPAGAAGQPSARSGVRMQRTAQRAAAAAWRRRRSTKSSRSWPQNSSPSTT